MKLINARSSLAPAPVKQMKPLPLSFAAHSRLKRFNLVPSATWSAALVNCGFSPQLRTTLFALGSFPTGTLACGTFGISRSKLRCSSSTALTRCVKPAICSPIFRTSASSSSLDSLRKRRAPISLLRRLRSDCSRCSSVSLLRRSASIRNTSSIFASSPPPRVARRSRTKSGFSRIRRTSSMAQIVESGVVGGKCDWVTHASRLLASGRRVETNFS